jgi:hypothetical protein
MVMKYKEVYFLLPALIVTEISILAATCARMLHFIEK